VYICKQQGIGDPMTQSTAQKPFFDERVYALVRIIVLEKPNLLNLLVDSTPKQAGGRGGLGEIFRLISLCRCFRPATYQGEYPM
jgi:hypothetical protein